ncbi:MAG: hypothetical protein ABI878_11670 [Acidobacteriota bacterium]
MSNIRIQTCPNAPKEIATIKDVDLMQQAGKKIDPVRPIAKGLVSLKSPGGTSLLRHAFDPIPKGHVCPMRLCELA